MLLLFLVGALFALFLFFPQIHKGRKKRKHNQENLFKYTRKLKNIVDIIVNHLQLTTAFHSTYYQGEESHLFLLPSYEIIPSDTHTFTKNNIIHLKIYDENGTIRNVNILLTEILQEVSGLISEDEHEEIQMLLVNTCKILHYCD